jgi:hypothetical protein
MITAKHIRELLTATPFKAFRLFVSDGSFHDVPHPELAWVVGSNRVFLASVSGDDHDDPAVKQLSVLHLTRIEELDEQRRAA